MKRKMDLLLLLLFPLSSIQLLNHGHLIGKAVSQSVDSLYFYSYLIVTRSGRPFASNLPRQVSFLGHAVVYRFLLPLLLMPLVLHVLLEEKVR